MQALIKQLESQGIVLYLEGDKLKYKAQKGAMTESCLAQIRTHKESLISELKQNVNRADSDRLFEVLGNNHSDLSFGQRRIWFIDQLEEGAVQYNMPMAFDVSGVLDWKALRNALNKVVERHTVLRTVIYEEKGSAKTKLLTDYEVPFVVHELSEKSESERDAFVADLLDKETCTVFNLSEDVLIRGALVSCDSENHILILNLHHIAADGWSLDLLMREVSSLYSHYVTGHAAKLPTIPIQYRDFARWKNAWMKKSEAQLSREYWAEKLRDIPERHTLPVRGKDARDVTNQKGNAEIVKYEYEGEKSQAIRQFCKNTNLTSFMFFESLLACAISKVSGAKDVVIGVPVAGRQHSDTKDLIGYFVNTVALRTKLDDSATFKQVLSNTRRDILETFEHQDLPFESIVEQLGLSREIDVTPVFQILFNMQQVNTGQICLGDVTFKERKLSANTVKFDLEVIVNEQNDGFECSWKYDTSVFSEENIARLANAFERLIDSVLLDAENVVSAVDILLPEDISRLSEWNDTAYPFPEESSIVSLFEEQVALNSDTEAVRFRGQGLSYRELDEKSGQLASYLMSQGVGPGSLVGVCMERSLSLMVAMMGILKAGGAYVALDPGYPADRLAYMLEDSGCEYVLSQTGVSDVLPTGEHRVLALDDTFSQAAFSGGLSSPLPPVPSDSLCYVIYTSGSTGAPKGVCVEHRALVNRLHWMQRRYGLSVSERVLQKTPYSFDVSVWELFWPLISGATVVFSEPEGHKDDAYLTRVIQEEKISTLHFVPTMLRMILQSPGWSDCQSLRQVFCSGEALSMDLVKRFESSAVAARLYNLYGPTEAAIDVTYWDGGSSHASGEVPIGRAIDNIQLYVLDSQMRRMPPGSVGELYLGGAGLARGYLNKPELTAERFVANPYGEGRLYRTGDLVRWLPDGELAYTGRNDHQIKLRGFRIELGEIESHLQSVAGVNDAVVQVHDAGAQPRLVAYVVSEEPEAALSEKLSGHLRSSLPEYMVPGQYVVLSALPQLPNGKVDRKQLVPPSLSEETTYRAPQTETERQLCEVWSEVLKVERVGTEDNFFGLGGDSILSIQVVSRCRQLGLRVSVRQLFEHQTVRRLSQVVSALDAGTEAEQGEVTGEQVLLPVQRQFFEQTLSQPNHYNQSVLLKTPPGFTVEALQAIVQGWYARHDSLHVRFVPEGQSFRGVYTRLGEEQVRTGIQYYDMRAVPLSARASRQLALCEAAQASLDIGQGELFRAVYFEYEEEGRLLLVLHHLIVDGISWRILLPELELAWQQLSSGAPVVFAQKSSSYQQFGQALQAYSQSEALHQELAYWVSQAPQPVVLPSGDAGSGRAQVSLDEEQTRALLGRCNEAYRTQINELLLSALLRGYQRWSGESGLSLHMEGHGREELFSELDISETLGWFTSMYPLRLTASPEDDTGTLIQEVKEQCRAIPNNGIGYGVLRYLSQAEGLQAQGVGEVEFNYLGQFDNTLDASSAFALSDEPMGASVSGENVSPVRLSVNGLVNQGCLQFTLEAKTPDVALAGFAEAFQAALLECVNHCDGHRGGFTPGDFPYATLDGARIKALEARYPSLSKVYMATGMQSGMLFHDLLAEEGTVYNSQIYCDLDGALDVARLEQAWNHVISRHDILRTAFDGFEQEQLHQVVSEQVSLRIAYYDWRDADDVTARIAEYQQQDKHQAFDFAQAPLMRVSVIRMTSSRYHLVWTHHHALLDGWCTPVVFAEVMRLYEADNDLAEAGLPAVQDYEQYIGWLLSQDEEAARAYWREALSGFDSVNTLSLPVPQAPRSGVGMINTGLSVRDSEALSRLAREHHVTVNVILQAAWGYVLSCYSGQRDVVYGATVSGRPSELPGVDTMMGLFINTLPVRMQLSAEQTVGEVLSSLQQGHVQRDEFSYLPLSEIQRVSESGAGAALFDTLLVFENYPMDEMVAGVNRAEALGLTVSGTGSNNLSNYGLSLTAHMSKGQLSCELVYQQSRYEQSSIEQLWRHLSRVLQQIAQGGLSQQMRDLQLLDEQEQQALLNLHGECKDIPVHRCLHELFESQAAASPDATAVICEGEHLSYGELNRRANQLAHRLRQQGVTGDSLVGLCTHRSFEMLTGMLGILKAGGAYVPLDPAYPAARLNYMIKDAGLSLIVTEPGVTLPALETPLSLLQIADEALQDCPDDNLTAEDVTPHNLAYIIYTSGSTGQPKGVMVEHRNVVRLFESARPYFNYDSSDVWTMFHSYAFDFSVWEIWGALLYGGSCVIVPRHIAPNPVDFAKLVRENAVTMLSQTPSAFYPLLNHWIESSENNAVRCIVFGGEALDFGQLKYWFESPVNESARLINMYGITETTVHVTYKEITSDDCQNDISNIGKPLSDLSTLVLDSYGNIQVPGLPGELYVAGGGVTRGYLGKPELSAERFCSLANSGGPEIYYKTGDAASISEDGTLQYQGRIDHQVKIRGYRIELGEIETELNRIEFITNSAVVVTGSGANKSLVAFISVQDEDLKDQVKEQCIELLSDSLPEYMVPRHYRVIKALPLTTNGKINKTQLVESIQSTDLLQKEFVPAKTHTEKGLCRIWQDLLHIEAVSTDDNFFELGGHSLLINRLTAQISSLFHVKVPMSIVFEVRSLRELAEYIDSQEKDIEQKDGGSDADSHAPVLSYGQERLYLAQKIAPDSTQYNVTSGLKLNGSLNLQKVKSALITLVNRHDVLRTTVEEVAGAYLPRVHNDYQVAILHEDLKALPESEAENQVKYIAESITREPFDLSIDLPIRMCVIELTETSYVLIFSIHHMAIDARSIDILSSEFVQIYGSMVHHEGEVESLPEIRSYYEFAARQRRALSEGSIEGLSRFWQKQLQSLPRIHSLPVDFPRSFVSQGKAGHFKASLTPALRTSIENYCRQTSITPFMFYHSVLTILMFKLGGESKIAVRTAVEGREQEEFRDVVGFFVNDLVLTANVTSDSSLKTQLQKNKQVVLSAFDHQQMPFNMLQELVPEHKDRMIAPIAQVKIDYSTEESNICQFGDVMVTPLELTGSEFLDLDLYVNVVARNQEIELDWNFNTALFEEQTIARFNRYFAELIDDFLRDDSQKIDTIPICSEDELKQILTQFNQPAGDLNLPLIQARIEQIAEQTPTKLALSSSKINMSYEQLNAQSNRLARLLMKLDIGKDDKVVLCMERSPAFVVCMLGVLKAGAAYVPVDPALPQSRVDFILEDCGCKVVLTQSDILDGMSFDETPYLVLDDHGKSEIIDSYPEDSMSHEERPVVCGNDLAYVIYTSGTTGQPKGVMIEHRNLSNYIRGYVQVSGLASESVHLQNASMSFDVSVSEWAPCLWCGGQLVISDDKDKYSPELLIQLMQLRQVTHALLAPALFTQAISVNCDSIETVSLAGEAFDKGVIANIRRCFPKAKILNGYGPTETTCGSHFGEVDSDKIDIGKTLPGVVSVIVDESDQLCPIGYPGELLIGGHGVSRGYINQPELTANKFIVNPYKALGTDRLYRTGDRAVWLENGKIQYISRLDSMVKLRGYRVELSEIETRLAELPFIDSAIATVLKDENELDQLVAYFTVSEVDSDEEQTWTAKLLKQHLAKFLPSYMLPAAYLEIEEIPLTFNGKIDKDKLPGIDEIDFNLRDFVAPQTTLQGVLCNIYEQILDLESVGIEDDFFLLGGQSLLATQVVSEVRAQLKIELPVTYLFQFPCVRDLAEELEKIKPAKILDKIETIDRTQPGVLSFGQQRLWFIDQLNGGSAIYNMPGAIRLEGDVQQAAICDAIQSILTRHTILTTKYLVVDGAPRQKVSVDFSLPVFEHDLSQIAVSEQEEQVRQLLNNEIHHRFDLSEDLPIRIILVKQADDCHVIIFNIHHIACDGWSMKLLIQEFTETYRAIVNNECKNVPDLDIQYQDYASWQHTLVERGEFNRQLSYWEEQLNNLPAVHSLPLDKNRPTKQGYTAGSFVYSLPKALGHQLKVLCESQDVTLFMVLQTALSVLIARYSNEKDIVIGSPIAGRVHKELEPLVGLFVNNLVLRTQIEGNPTFVELLQQNKSMILEAYENQSVPFDLLVERLHPDRNLAFSPLFQIVLTMRNAYAANHEMEGISVTGIDALAENIRFDLEIDVSENDGQIDLIWKFADSIFELESIRRMATHFENILAGICDKPSIEVETVNLMTANESKLLFMQSLADSDVCENPLTLSELFEQRVKESPDALAIVCDDRRLTYKELDVKASQVAKKIDLTVKNDNPMIGLCVNRSIEMVVGMLGILKAGGGYVPLDPSYPIERLQFIAQDTNLQLVLSQSQLGELVRTFSVDSLLLDCETLQENVTDCSLENDIERRLEQVAYVIYTSGSTGKPKGVPITHQNVTRLLSHCGSLFQFQRDDVWSMSHSFAFDFSVWEIWGPLTSGARLVIVPLEKAVAQDQFANLIVEEQVTMLSQTPSAFEALQPYLLELENKCKLRYITFGGEKLEMSSLNDWFKAPISDTTTLVNMYGITETTVHVTFKRIHAEDVHMKHSNIGNALPDLSTFVLNEAMQLQPIGVPGELYIGGPGLTQGYLNRPELNEERFRHHDFGGLQMRLYKTGDLACWLDSGELAYLGRCDGQVKIRGFRIEPGEIASVLTRHPAVSNAVVVPQKDRRGELQLVACVVCPDSKVSSALDELKSSIFELVEQYLPSYMHPAHIHCIDEIPLTRNGKVDTARLPVVELQGANAVFVPPETQIEKQLCAIWQKHLHIDKVGITDNFFHLGGHSLLATSLVSSIRAELDIELPVVALFENPTISSLIVACEQYKDTPLLGEVLPAQKHEQEIEDGEL